MTGITPIRAVSCAIAMIFGLAGCAAMPKMGRLGEAPIAADSPVARQVLEASGNPGPYPRFSDIPKVPTDVRPVSEWRAAVTSSEADLARIRAEAAAMPATLTDTEGWAARTRAQAEAPPPADALSTEEFLAEMRAKAKPPAPPK